MSAGRILLLLIVVAVTAWLVRSSPLLKPASPDPGSASPIQKARTAAAAASGRASHTDEAQTGDSPPAGGSITENMTPEQVRAVLGAPDSVDSETTESGVARERWTYRRAAKTVVFENGIAVRIE